MFKTIRIIVLLCILAVVAVGTWRSKVNAVKWKYTLPVNIYPINGDGRLATQTYIRSLTPDDFKPIEVFMQAQAQRYGRDAQASIDIRLGPMIDSLPPLPPVRGNAFDAVVWSLRMRWWAYRHGETKGPGPQVKMYLLYFDPAQTQRLSHSTALQKGLIGVAKVFASAEMAGPNNIVVTHEFLHTLGATDKYDPVSQQPVFPQGYAEPERQPVWPQRYTEIMGGSTPMTPTRSEQANSLRQVVIGEQTAQEINWRPAAP